MGKELNLQKMYMGKMATGIGLVGLSTSHHLTPNEQTGFVLRECSLFPSPQIFPSNAQGKLIQEKEEIGHPWFTFTTL